MHSSQLILIAGPSGSGKSTLASKLASLIQEAGHSSIVLSLDHYYRDLHHLTMEEREQENFDAPDAWECERILKDAKRLKSGEPIEMPLYDFSTHLRQEETMTVLPHDVILMEGLFALCFEELNQLADLKIFVEIEDAVALERRIRRDTEERGRSRESVIERYKSTVYPANARYIEPSAKKAQVHISGTVPFQDQLAGIRSKATEEQAILRFLK